MIKDINEVSKTITDALSLNQDFEKKSQKVEQKEQLKLIKNLKPNPNFVSYRKKFMMKF